MEKVVGAHCRYVYVGHITWNGSRQVLFYVDKPDSVVETLKKLAGNHPLRTFSVKYERDEHWDKIKMYFEVAKGS